MLLQLEYDSTVLRPEVYVHRRKKIDTFTTTSNAYTDSRLVSHVRSRCFRVNVAVPSSVSFAAMPARLWWMRRSSYCTYDSDNYIIRSGQRCRRGSLKTHWQSINVPGGRTARCFRKTIRKGSRNIFRRKHFVHDVKLKRKSLLLVVTNSRVIHKTKKKTKLNRELCWPCETDDCTDAGQKCGLGRSGWR